MKNILLVVILMIGLLFTAAIGNPVMARPPELVSGPPQITSTRPSELVSEPPQELANVISSANPETTISASVSSSIEATVGDTEPVATGNFFTNNWGALLMGLLGFADLVARLTPSVKDNSIINFLITILNTIIPNLKKGGGSF